MLKSLSRLLTYFGFRNSFHRISECDFIIKICSFGRFPLSILPRLDEPVEYICRLQPIRLLSGNVNISNVCCCDQYKEYHRRHTHQTSKYIGFNHASLLLGGIALFGLGQESCDSDDSTAKDSEESIPPTANRSRSFFSLPVVQAARRLSLDGTGDPGNGGFNRRSRFNFIAEAVKEAGNALVFIEVKDSFSRDPITGYPVTSSNGSGFIVKEDGLILTNAHVVINKPRASVQIRLSDGRTFTGIVEDVDIRSDLATVRIEANQLPVMKLGDSSQIVPGEFVIAMGSPLSLSNTITIGVVSSVARPKAELGMKSRDVAEYIQTDAAITFGNSGGPLINLDGEAIGINSMKVTPGISFAIPIDHAKEFLKRSAESRASGWKPSRHGGGSGGINRRYMGITMLSLNSQIIDQLRDRASIPSNLSHGILVMKVIVDSPADHAGIKPGDILTHINKQEIYSSRDVYKLLEGDQELSIRLVRSNKAFKVKVNPEE